jgi:ribosomal protein S12 methylthiotransferase accessory factor
LSVAAPSADRPRTNPVIQAGLAAGASLEQAQCSAVCELVERDAMTMSWHGCAGIRRVEPPAWVARLARGPCRALHTRFFDFPNDFGLPVIGALMIDGTTDYMTMGMGCRPNPLRAMVKALGEALQLQLLVASYDDPNGPIMRLAAHPRSPLKPWRADRDYAAAYRSDLRDVVDYACHLQMFLDPVFQSQFEAELEGATIADVPITSVAAGFGPTSAAETPGPAPARAHASELRDLAQRLADAGHRLISVDVTTDDVRGAGLHVVRVIAPGLYSNSAAGLPFLGGTRLSEAIAEAPDGRRRALPLPH